MTEIRKELERLIELNYAEQWVPHHIAFQQLIERHGDRLIAGLVECLTDEDAEFRQLAASLLDEAGQRAKPALEALTERLSDENRGVKCSAVSCLGGLGPFARSAILALKKVMNNTKEPYLQIMAAGAISKIVPEDPSTIPILVAALDDPNSFHRAAACEFLGERRHSAALNTMKLFSDPDFTVRFAAAKAYSKFTGDWMHTVSVCVAMLKDENETHRA